MHERLTEDQRILTAGDGLDPGIRQTPVLVCPEDKADNLEFPVMFSSLIGRKCAGKLLFGAYIRLLLNREEVQVLN